ncbi:MAG: UDP-glucose/GDP-mannose dehydrogenase family protein [Actinobacteria bacterium]|nr:UDP-glucose/GDP-mannose dehydrogenase family protein [Actinomycetota bacterium]MCL6105485.1 UDP-glucose/GDP-mannose dehydrogenase family protein [Actinomycetota bacterium]
MAKIGVIGAGYVGIATAICFSYLGNDVVCADIVEEKIDKLNRGEMPILEEGMGELLSQGLAKGSLKFVMGAANAARQREFVFLCVPTPSTDTGTVDMSYIQKAAQEIAPVLEPGSIVVTKSTVPVGSTVFVQQFLARDDISVVSNPEFLKEGSALHDTLHPDRIVIGSSDTSAAMRIKELYKDIYAPVLITDSASAEVIKYASNAFLAAKISFANAVANLCEAVDADVKDVLLAMGYDRRIGFDFLRPGPGWGGSCFPKDTKALVCIGAEAGYEFALLKGIIAANREQLERVIEKINLALGGEMEGKTVALLGLTFKANTDDLRESPAIAVAEQLLLRNVVVQAYDPTVEDRSSMLSAGIQICSSAYEASKDAHLLVIMTEWGEFYKLDYNKVKELMMYPCIVDTRNLLDPDAVKRLGFSYVGMGRK